MNPIDRFRRAGWRAPAALAAVAGVEAWLLLAADLKLGGPAFELLCALSCWLPAWCCADLLATRSLQAAGRHEWTVPEVVNRAAVRLIPVLLALSLWCGTFTYRSLRAELPVTTPQFFAVIHDAEHLIPVWIAWTAVFVASGFGYGGGAALLSATTRRPRRWLIVPAVVLGVSLALTLVAWGTACLRFGEREALPFTNGASPVSSLRQTLFAPNFMFGSTSALFAVKELSEHHEELLRLADPYIPPGIAIFCWIATLLFLAFGGAAWLGVARLAQNRFRRHPYTAAAGPPAESRPEASA